jgi:hypothetical protein
MELVFAKRCYRDRNKDAINAILLWYTTFISRPRESKEHGLQMYLRPTNNLWLDSLQMQIKYETKYAK